LVRGADDVEGVPAPRDPVGAGQRRCSELADLAGAQNEPVERAAVVVADDQRLAAVKVMRAFAMVRMDIVKGVSPAM
jgi:hypothetical protein